MVGTINNADYQGSATGTLVIAKATAGISWTPAATISYGTSLAGELTATASYRSASVAGTFNYTAQPAGGAAASVTGSTFLQAGSYTLAATFTPTDSTDYNSASGSAAVTVTKGTLTASANNATRVYGTANPTFTGSVSGAANSDTFTETFSTTATITSNAGGYSIVPTPAGTDLGDYTVAVQNGTLTVSQAGSATSLSASGGGSATPGQSVTLTAQVVPATTGTPTGTVSFYDGTTLLNTATLASGTASITTTGLSAGTTNQLSAVYGGDTNFTSSTSSPVGIGVAALDFTMTASGSTAQTVNPGSAAAYQLTVSPLYGAYAGAVTFTVSGLPSGATATFSPSTIAATGGQQAVTMTVQTSASSAKESHPAFPTTKSALRPVALGLLLLLGLGGMRRRGKNLRLLLPVVLLLVSGAILLMNGCGGGSSMSSQGSTPVTSMLTVTATSSTLQHTATVSLTVE